MLLFISYSHNDEWLKDEFIEHLSALKRSGAIDDWHDRKIIAGENLDSEIDDNINKSDIICFLISSSFIRSDYCSKIEYETAMARYKEGKSRVVPIIIRHCDWDFAELRSLLAIPKDGQPVTTLSAKPEEKAVRDYAWTQVISELKRVIAAQKANQKIPSLKSEYVENEFKTRAFKHKAVDDIVDERKLFVSPNFYIENEKIIESNFENIVDIVLENKATIIHGGDRSGKSLIAKISQLKISEIKPTLLVNGNQFKNLNFDKVLRKSIDAQFTDASEASFDQFHIIIDDFESCSLSDSHKELFVRYLFDNFASQTIIGFSNSASTYFTPDDLPIPVILAIEPLGDDKVYALTRMWYSIGLSNNDDNELSDIDDNKIINLVEAINQLFLQTEFIKTAYQVLTIIEILENSSGADIAFSSLASCYDALIQQRLMRGGIEIEKFDEVKNFISLVAYRCYVHNSDRYISLALFNECVSLFEDKYLSGGESLRIATKKCFAKEVDGLIIFDEDYLWYYFCARYVASKLSDESERDYKKFIETCVSNIFQKKYANILIYISYFLKDNHVIDQLVLFMGKLFDKVDNWKLSDEAKSIMLGVKDDAFLTEDKGRFVKNREELLKDSISNIIENSEKVVASYTLPFASKPIEDIDINADRNNDFDISSYMSNVNAMFRVHSVMSQILASRPGTIEKEKFIYAIEEMVKCSGRFARLNHAIAAVLIYDKENSLPEVEAAFPKDGMPLMERYKRVTKIYSFWSVYLAQAGLGRYLSQDHCIRALDVLIDKHERDDTESEKPFNFSSVRFVAKLWKDKSVDKSGVDELLERYGKNSAIFGLVRTALYFFSNYMPLGYADKQWVSQKVNMRITGLRNQEQRKALRERK